MENELKITSNSIETTDKIGQALAESFKSKGGLLSMYGDIGAGKTTLTKSIGKYLNIKEKITSPSFVILNEYHTGDIPVYHFDLYRLENEGLSTILGEIREYTETEKALSIIEWSEFSHGELPNERLELKISYHSETERFFEFKSYGEKHSYILAKIAQELENEHISI